MVKTSLYTIFHFLSALVLSYLTLVLVTDLKFPADWSYACWSIFSLEVLALNHFLARCSCRSLPLLFSGKPSVPCR